MDASRIDLIFDRYFTPSIKDTEHDLRENVQDIEFCISGPDQVRTIDFGKSLKNIKFKQAFTNFLIKDWERQDVAYLINDKTININYDLCYQFKVENGFVSKTINEDLTCQNHEEADTKIAFHIFNLTEANNIIVRSSDTDVLIILLGNMCNLKCESKIWMDTGIGNSRRFININNLYKKLGPQLADALPGFHAMTGCDFNPSLYRKAKIRPFSVLENSKKYQIAFADLGRYCMDNQDEVFEVLEEYTCRLYNMKNIKKVNDARMEIFSRTYKVKNTSNAFNIDVKNYDACTLPPCQAELKEHLLRSRYIATIWKNAHLQNPTELLPTDYGYEECEGKLTFHWFSGNQLPDAYEDIIEKKELDPESDSEQEVSNDDPELSSDDSDEDDSYSESEEDEL